MTKAYKMLSNLSRPFTVIVEGNIACGKTTFLNYISTHYDNVCVLAEPVNLWRNCEGHNLLKLFYDDPKKWSFSFQSYIQLTILQNHLHNPPVPVKLMERSLYSGRYCFVDKLKKDGLFPSASASVVDEWFKWLVKNMNVGVDLVIYLRSSPEVAFDRLVKRDRSEEKKVPLEYLQELHVLHENWLYYKKSYMCPAPVLVLDSNLNETEMVKEYGRFESVLSQNFQRSLKAK